MALAVLSSTEAYQKGKKRTLKVTYHLPLLEHLPEQCKSNGLSVVHVSFAGVITEQTVDHDGFFPLRKPAILPTKPMAGLTWTRRHEDPRENTNHKRDTTLDEKQPLKNTVSSCSDRRFTGLRIHPNRCMCLIGGFLSWMCMDVYGCVWTHIKFTHHCHPLHPLKPLICKMPAASNDPTMLTVLRAVQKNARRVGSSVLL